MKPAALVRLEKICQTCSFSCKSMKSKKFTFQLFLTTLKMALAAYTLHRIVVTLYFRRKTFVTEPVIYNSNFKNTQLKTKGLKELGNRIFRTILVWSLFHLIEFM